jgi:hypothetical protein
MIKYGDQPVDNHMTAVTGQYGWYMVYSLTLSNNTVVTTLTGTDHFVVIDGTCCNRDPGRWTNQMTGVANIAAEYMCCSLAGCDVAVMTGNTTANNLGMINRAGCYRDPGCCRCMAGITNVCGIDMACTLTAGANTIMTGKTGRRTNGAVIKYGNQPVR